MRRSVKLGRVLGLTLLAACLCGEVHPQFASESVHRPVTADWSIPEIPLYSKDASGTTTSEVFSAVPQPNGGMAVRNVTRPTLTPFLPPPGKANGAAVIVAPGGAFVGLAMDLEGYRIAHTLADAGIAAFVLKYRLIPTAADGHDIGTIATALIAKGMAHPDSVLDQQYVPAQQDGIAAVAYVRAHAAQWGVDPARVGMLGFSAGAMTAMSTVLHASAEGEPSFVGYIYGPEVPLVAPANAPPLFIAFALDDPLFPARNFPVVEAWQKAKRPVEVHAYQKGGHGFAGGVSGTTTTLVIPEFITWLRMNGFLTSSADQSGSSTTHGQGSAP